MIHLSTKRSWLQLDCPINRTRKQLIVDISLDAQRRRRRRRKRKRRMITTATAATKRPGRLFKLTSLFLCFFCLFVFLSFLYSFFFFLFDLVGCRQLVLIKWLRFLPNVLSSSRQAQSIRTILISILIRFHSPPPPWFFLVLLMMRNEVSGRGELFETDVTFSTLRSTPSLIVGEIGVSPHRSP